MNNLDNDLLHLLNSTDDSTAESITRRRFLISALAASFVGSLNHLAYAAQSAEIPKRALGRTGEKVSCIGLGGYHIGVPRDEDEAIKIVHTAIDAGINFMDNCWDYNKGVSEMRMGKALAMNGYRNKVFLMTKVDARSAKGFNQQLNESLMRLQTDHVDLIQFHEIIRMNDPNPIFGKHGAMQAALAAKQAGKVRFIGFTGHKSPDIHLHMLATGLAHGFVFDTVQMPLNCMDGHTQGFEKRVLPELLKHNIGVLGMKPMASGVAPQTGELTGEECLHYALNLPVSVVITGCDRMEILEQAIRAGRTFKKLPEEKIAAILAKSQKFQASGLFEKYKTTTNFDATAAHPAWLS
ncbi:MAG TPA: aldo/keto reductase [Planktothrix sp.]|jgi:aryl-alcohol dehydrogenase-like predicted oxidoreductase